MIDPKELRIGNLIYKQSLKLIPDKSVVWSIDKVVPQSSHMYDPIPITPESLELLGFVYTDFNGVRCGTVYTMDAAGVWTNMPIVLEALGKYWCRINGVYHDVKYVHQLQNIFYIVTGKELNAYTIIEKWNRENYG